VSTSFAYYAFPVPLRPWVHYAMSGLLFAVAGWVAHLHCSAAYLATPITRPMRRGGWLAGVAGASLMVWDGLQQAFCGAVDASTGGVDVCRAWLGSDLYSMLVSAAGAALAVTTWQIRQLRR
jgi:hypothetical protein